MGYYLKELAPAKYSYDNIRAIEVSTPQAQQVSIPQHTCPLQIQNKSHYDLRLLSYYTYRYYDPVNRQCLQS